MKITTEKFKTTHELVGGKPRGSDRWMAYGENPAFTGFGETEDEAVADLEARRMTAEG